MHIKGLAFGPAPLRFELGALAKIMPFLVLALSLCLTSLVRADDMAPARIRVVIDNNYPPYCFLDGEGHLQGSLIDRWRLWEKKTGIPLELVGLDWNEALTRMKAGEFDVIDTIFETEDRKTFLDYSKPHTSIDVPIFFHRNISGITGIASLKGFPVGVKQGDAVIQTLHEAGINTLHYFNNYESVVRAASQNKIHVFVVDGPPGLYFLHKLGIESEYRQTEPIDSGKFHRGYPKGRIALVETVENGFASISEAENAAIEKKWFGTATGSRIAMKWTIASAAAVLILLTGLIVWNQMLRWQVEKRTAALRESENKFREAIEFMPMPAGIADNDGTILFLNREFTAHYGYAKEDTPTLGQWFMQAYPDKNYREQVRALWDEDLAKTVPEASTTRKRTYHVTCKDGSQREVEIVMRLIGKLMLSTFNDVTDRNKTERELQQSESRYRRLHETMQDAFASVDMKGVIIESNRAFREMLGYTEEELRELSYSEITPEKWHALEHSVLGEQVMKRGFSEVYEKEYRRKDGTILPVELRTYLLKNNEDQPCGMWAIIRETSERKQMESQLIQVQKMEAIGQLAGGVAHDFNNILASILLNISMLQTSRELDNSIRDVLQDVRNDINKAAALTKQLLAFSRRQEMQMAPVNLGALITNSLGMLRRLLGESIHIEYLAAGDLPVITGNQGMLEQVLMNLCVNARDAMPNGGKLLLHTGVIFVEQSAAAKHQGASVGRHVQLNVTDTGMGMDATVCRRIFEPFFTTKELGRGTGLGLSIVFGIIKQHGGWIEVESTVGIGTTFHVNLPAADTHSPQGKGENLETMEMGKGERILVVEDESGLRAILQAGLIGLGYEVEAAPGPEEAQLLWDQRSGDFDLLLTDMIMPGGVTGLHLATALCELKPDLKVVISSGYHKEFDDLDVPPGVRIHKIHKPFALETLSKLLRVVLGS